MLKKKYKEHTEQINGSERLKKITKGITNKQKTIKEMNRKKGRERKNQKVSHSPPLPPKKKVPTKKSRSKRKSKTSDFYLCALYS